MPLNVTTISDRERMKTLTARLKHRVVIQKAEQQVDTGDGFGDYPTAAPIKRGYVDLKTVWCFIQPKSSLTDFVSAVRGEQEFDRVTHEFWVRREAVRGLGAAFSAAYSTGFDTVQQINPIKNDFFLFLKEGTTTKGRRFQCKETRMDERNHEYLMIRCKEVEEVGTGWAP
jgi:head-tail adaptor